MDKILLHIKEICKVCNGIFGQGSTNSCYNCFGNGYNEKIIEVCEYEEIKNE